MVFIQHQLMTKNINSLIILVINGLGKTNANKKALVHIGASVSFEMMNSGNT